MAAASLYPDLKILNDFDVEEYQQPETSHEIPTEVMADLDIPGYTWLYLTVPDATNPSRNLTFPAGGTDRTRVSRARSEHQATQQSAGDQGRATREDHLAFKEKDKYNVDTAKRSVFKLPHILLTNAHSLQNKMEDLRDRIRTDGEIQNCELMCFTETWLPESSRLGVPDYDDFHYPRDPNRTQKERGGGLGVLIRNGVRAEVCGQKQSPNYQIMLFIYETENHPQNAPPLIFMLVYIQPQAKRPITKQEIEAYYHEALDRSNGGPVFILGDFNWYDFLGSRPSSIVEQYVTCPTRGNNILDKCYGNILKAYRSQCKRPLCSTNTQSDHNVILLTKRNQQCSHSECREEELEQTSQMDRLSLSNSS